MSFVGVLVAQWSKCWQKSHRGLNMRPWQRYSRLPPSPPTRFCPRTRPTRHGTSSAAFLWKPNTGPVLRSCSDTLSPRYCVETCMVSELNHRVASAACAASLRSQKSRHRDDWDVSVKGTALLPGLRYFKEDFSQAHPKNTNNTDHGSQHEALEMPVCALTRVSTRGEQNTD